MKKLLSLILVLCMVLSLAACGGDKAEPTPDPSAGESKAPEPQKTEAPDNEDEPKGGETITIAWAQSDGTQVEVMEDYVMPALEDAFPDVNFEYTAITTDKAEALKTMSATDELTDIYCSDSGIYSTLLAAGDFLDLAPYLEADGWLDANYNNPALLYAGDTMYNVSCGQNDYYTPVFYYNTELFEEHNLSEPTTMDEFLQLCRDLIALDITPMTTSTDFMMFFMIDGFISSYNPELLNDLHAGKVEWTDEGIVEALKVFDELKLMGAFTADSSNKPDSDNLAEFSNGTVAMWPSMSWYNYNVAEGEVPFTTGTFNFPSGNPDYPTGYQQLNWGSVYGGWAVHPKTDDVDLAIDVLKVILQAEAQRHADNGITENFIVEGAAEPTNPLEIERMADYNAATDYRTLLFIVAMDAATVSDFYTGLSMLISDDDSYLSEDFIAEFQPSWEMNTKVER